MSVGVDLENPTGNGFNVRKIGICPQSRAYSLEGERDSDR